MTPDTQQTAHVVVTRFAVRLGAEGRVPTPQWITERCDLFETYCLPSLEAQTCQDFTWILLVDPDISPDQRSRIEAYSQRFPRIVVRDVINDTLQSHREAISSVVPHEVTRLVTTRIDSDDAVSIDHLQRLRDTAADLDRTGVFALVFTSGFELSQNRLYWRPFPRSPFASLVEPALDQPITVMAAPHEQISTLGMVVELSSPPAWIQVVHGSNILNRVRGVRVPRSRLARSFVTNDLRLEEPESLLSLIVGVPASWLRLAVDIAANPRYLSKVAALFRPARRG